MEGKETTPDLRDIPTLEFDSRYGTVEVLFWGSAGLGVRSKNTYEADQATVNGIQVNFWSQLKEYPGDGYCIERTEHGHPDYRSVNVRRLDSFKTASDSARRKVIDLCVELANHVEETRQDKIAEGYVVEQSNILRNLQDKRFKLKEELEEVEGLVVDGARALALARSNHILEVERKSAE